MRTPTTIPTTVVALAMITQRLQQDVPGGEVRPDLALDALQGVVDRLGVAAEALADLLVAVAVEVQREHARLQLGQRRGQAGDQRLQLLGADDLVDRVVHRRAGDDLVERRLAVLGGGGRGRERDVLVQRRVLVARRRLDRGDDLARDAELGEVAEARLAVGPVVAHGLVEADEALLDEVVRVAAGQEVRGRLQADEAVVAPHDAVIGDRIALLGKGDQVAIIDLNLPLRVEGETCHERILSARMQGKLLSGALLPWRHLKSSRPEVLNLRSTVMWADPPTVMERRQGCAGILAMPSAPRAGFEPSFGPGRFSARWRGRPGRRTAAPPRRPRRSASPRARASAARRCRRTWRGRGDGGRCPRRP